VDLPELLVHLRELARERLGERARDTAGVSSLSGVLSAQPALISAAAPREARSPLAASSFNVVRMCRFSAAAQWQA
jgi:hypothetical protein